MHLHEFCVAETLAIAQAAGFDDVASIFAMGELAVRSHSYTRYLRVADQILRHDAYAALRPLIVKFRKALLLRSDLFMSLKK